MVKAIFFDIDGTLVSFKTHQMAQSTINALKQLQQQGIKLFIATGRHKIAINNLDNFPFDGYITLNGSICIVGNQTIYRHPIPDSDINTMIELLKTDQAFPCAFMQEDVFAMNSRDDATDKIFPTLDLPIPEVKPIDEIVISPVYQLISFFPEHKEDELMSLIPECKSVRWNPLFTDVIPIGGGKPAGIEKILEFFNLKKEETMAFGDGGNDITMLQYVQTGIAMGNAKDDVKSAADYITDDVDSDGVYKALKHFKLVE